MLAARTVLLLVMLLPYSLHQAAAHFTPTACCFHYAQKPVRSMQSLYFTSQNCSLPAVVIVTSTGVEICANPEERWVKRAMKKFQKKMELDLLLSTA